MNNERDAMITYNGNQINLFFDERSDYISLTDIYKAGNRYYKSISAWLKTKQTLEFLDAWERKNNPDYLLTHLSQIIKLARQKNGLSAKDWIAATKAKGIFTRPGIGTKAGTYAHKDIAIKFAGWLNPDFELFLVEEIQRLKKIENQIKSNEFVDKKTILYLIELKEVFKYVAHQKAVEETHKEVFAAHSNAKNPYAEFNKWRNEILNMTPEVINQRIEQYCKDKGIALTKKIFNKTKHEKLLMLDSLETVRNAVWDYLKIDGQIDALNLANLVYDIIKMENGQVLRDNVDTLFEKKQTGSIADFPYHLSEHPHVKSARQVLETRKKAEIKQLSSPMNKLLTGIIAVPPPPKDGL